MSNEDSNFNPCGNINGGCTFESVAGNLRCVPGDSACAPVNLLEAEKSAFHDQYLVKATKAIKTILAKIPADPNGRNLSFIHTNMGTLLAWVEHGGTPTTGAVTAKHDDATIAAALKLKL